MTMYVELRKRSGRRTRLSTARRIVCTLALFAHGVGHAAEGSNADGGEQGVSEVVVTAEKRTERLQDVPIPLSVVNTESLLETNQVRIQDYFTQVPGLSAIANNTNSQALAIRGVTTGTGTNPTVAVTVDDVPFGSSTYLGGGYVPDIDPSELARIEVLRGPQGTLYGASSLGGLVKYVTLDPSVDSLSGRVQAGTTFVHNGAEAGYNFRAAVNVPLTDTVAVRASAFTRQDPGYVDNPILHIKGVNEDHVTGGRLAALWRPSDTMSLRLSALYQDTKSDGLGDVELPVNGYSGPALYGLQQNYIPHAGAFEHKLQAYSADLKFKLGSAELTSITAYNNSHFLAAYDYSPEFSPYFTFPDYQVNGTLVSNNEATSKFTEELRLAVPLTSRADWLLGLFYTHERGPYNQSIIAEDENSGAFVHNEVTFFETITYAERSVFTDLTLHVTDQLDIQLGGRATHLDQSFDETDKGDIVPDLDSQPSPYIFPTVKTSANAFTYLLTPELKISKDLMVYARVASGYRPGGPNSGAIPFDLPLSFSPDKTQNYEVGVKGNVLDRLLTFDASLYYIDWKNIQLSYTLPSNGYGFVANGSRAKSRGAEISLESRPLTGLTVRTWVSLNRADLTETLPPDSSVYGVSGYALPFSSRFSGNFSVQQDIPVTDRVTAFGGVDVSYTGERFGNFQSPTGTGEPPPRQSYPGFAKTDLRAGVHYDNWNANLFASNIMDRRGQLNGGWGYVPPYSFAIIQPRTIGLSVSRTF